MWPGFAVRDRLLAITDGTNVDPTACANTDAVGTSRDQSAMERDGFFVWASDAAVDTAGVFDGNDRSPIRHEPDGVVARSTGWSSEHALRDLHS